MAAVVQGAEGLAGRGWWWGPHMVGGSQWGKQREGGRVLPLLIINPFAPRP